MEGALQKWTNYLFGWRERYFVLKGSILYYYYQKGEKPKGRIHLSVASISANSDDLKFEIDCGLSIVYMKAETKELRDDWVKALKKAKFEAEHKMANKQNDSMVNITLNEEKDCITNNRSLMQCDDKMLRKINLLYGSLDKLKSNTDLFSMYLKKTFGSNNVKTLNNELGRIFDNYKNDVGNLNMSLEDLRKTFIRFNKDFNKLSEYFFTNNEQAYLFDNNNLVSDNNHIEMVRSVYESEDIGIKRSRAKNKNNKNHLNTSDVEVVVTKNEELFYGVEDDLGNNSENDEPIKFNSTSKSPFDDKPNYTGDTARSNEPVEDENNLHNEIDLKINIQNVYKKNSNNKIKTKFYDEMYESKRFELPAKKKHLNLNVWSILKDAVGKDLSKFCVPVYFNEPLSMLQRLCENFQYADCLNKASTHPNPYWRLALVSAFAIGGFSTNIYRTLKFFNPLLSETFEYIDNDLNIRYFAEQVSHHPAISACFAEGDGFTYYTNTNAENKFKLLQGHLEFHPIGRTFVTFPNFNEVVSYTKPKAIVKNLIMGKMSLDCCGKIIVTNNTTGEVCELEIFEQTKDEQGKILGSVKDIYGNAKLKLEGNWLSHLDVIDCFSNERTTIWKKFSIPGDEEERFYFTDFAINLNYITEEMKQALPPTDSRFRPDQRALELQDYDLATKEKHKLEEKQRRTRKEREKNKIKYKPMYFEETYDDLTGELIYLYKGGYWEDRKNKKLEKFFDIY